MTPDQLKPGKRYRLTEILDCDPPSSIKLHKPNRHVRWTAWDHWPKGMVFECIAMDHGKHKLGLVYVGHGQYRGSPGFALTAHSPAFSTLVECLEPMRSK